MGSRWKQQTKNLLVTPTIFEKFGLRYIGPIDGHDFKQLDHYLKFAKKANGPVLLHILTTKGKGYDVALSNPEKFHGTSAFDISSGKNSESGIKAPKYQDVMGETSH